MCVRERYFLNINKDENLLILAISVFFPIKTKMARDPFPIIKVKM